MQERVKNANSVKMLDVGMHDAVVNGELIRDIQTRIVFVKDTTERDSNKEKMSAGQFVALYGLGHVYQLDGEGNWKTIR
jgi:hypothetical protein